jgi:transcriptional regulator with XRE-family HTH domain
MSYYFDVLPLHPKPRQLESFSSYLTRLAEANGIRFVKPLLGMFWNIQKFRQADCPPSALGNLPSSVACSEEILLSTTFFYLGKKFGQPGNPQILGLFLAGSVGSYLRYCPFCIKERSYYSLTWRFLCLPGCAEHHCTLLERCGHCGQTIPLFTAPLHMGICPSCQGDLRKLSSIPLTEQEWQRTITRSKDLAFLLTHQVWELESDRILIALGKHLMTKRLEKGLTQGEVADQLRMPIGHIGLMEKGLKQPSDDRIISQRYVTFHRFLAYSEYLGVSCVEGFAQALERKEQTIQPRNHGRHALRKQAAVAHAQRMLEQVQQAVQDLSKLGLPITTKAIAQKVGICRRHLYSFPEVSMFLEQIGCKQRHRQKKGSLGEEEVLELVRQALKQLEEQGQLATLSLVSTMTRIRMKTLLSYPQVQQLLEEVEAQHALLLCIRLKQCEDELIEKVQDAICLLKAKGLPVTKQSIADIVQLSVASLSR